MNNFPDIASLVPHQAPMLLIDKLIAVDELTIHCQVNIGAEGLFFDKQINGVPAWVGIEFMAQTVAAWSGYHAWLQDMPAPIGFLLGSRRYTTECEVYTQGALLDIYAQQLMESEGMTAFLCRIECAGKELATAQLNAFVPSQDKLDKMLKGKSND
ncbi:MAG: putative hotdog family 3-hydroxylacyl-ACP dehydratase [Psychromonas sp.]|jgi:predicted hotdog family 3-hydroxylacyl-ACP dehydratase|uniref:hotdog family protein n=1 Tax=Psychromonas sp. TaxID=1884585 RepID=UPI0039E6CCDB